MKTLQITSAKNLRSIVILISLSVSGMMMSSCSKEAAPVPGATASVSATGDNADQKVGSGDRFTLDLPLIYSESAGGFRGTPQYNFAVYKSGKVVYTGVRNVGTLGRKQFDVNAADISALATFMVAQGFLEMENKYPFICDGSKHTTMLRGDVGRQSVNKTVVDYSVAVPAQLLLIRKTLEDKLGITTLIEAKGTQTTAFDQSSQ